jgi:ATP-binding protein involved in chromosome partitioning
MNITNDSILNVLRGVIDPSSNNDVVTANMISGVQVVNGDVVFMIEVNPAQGAALEPLRIAAERAVQKIPGVKKVTAILTAERTPSQTTRKKPADGPSLPRIKNIIAVASGKGGVGKSTVAANLAVAMGRMGLKIGLLDADIYGPSVPRMMGLSGQKPGGQEGKIDPFMTHGIKIMSIGFMVGEEAPLIWRGPMVQSAILQLLRDVEWGDIDILVVDMPPGTGDAQLTMAQKVPLAGAIIVSTPQDIALIDARKGLEMFRKVNVPVLGIIENMSFYCCPACGHRDDIFGHGGAKAEAEKLNCEFLGEVPLHKDIRTAGDNGAPIVSVQPESMYANEFMNIAGRVVKKIQIES